ncbi:MAG: PIN domain-containing protein [Nitrospirae bacterium]|nr:PIN domain-containing protein [Nitrospirota bacterium]
MILIDTGPIVASFDKNDSHHNICLNVLKNLKAPLITTVPVLTEAFYLLGCSWYLQENLWEAIEHDTLRIYNMDRDILKRCHELMKKYQDLPMDLADASLVAVAESENIRTIFTLDHKDFKVYRTKQKGHFKLLPSKVG